MVKNFKEVKGPEELTGLLVSGQKIPVFTNGNSVGKDFDDSSSIDEVTFNGNPADYGPVSMKDFYQKTKPNYGHDFFGDRDFTNNKKD